MIAPPFGLPPTRKAVFGHLAGRVAPNAATAGAIALLGGLGGAASALVPGVAVASAVGIFLLLGLIGLSRWWGLSPAAVMFLVLLSGTSITGRVFSYVQIGPLYITDAVLLLLGLTLLLKAGLGRMSIARSVPSRFWWLLGGYFAVGLLAAARGIDSGTDTYYVARDAVLVAYSVSTVFIIALFKGPSDVRRVHKVLYWSAVPATAFAAATAATFDTGGIAVALGLYLSFFFLNVMARWTQGFRPARWEWVFVVVQFVLVTLLTARTAWVGALVAVGFLMLSGRPERRRRMLGGMMLTATVLVAIYTWLPPSVKESEVGVKIEHGVQGAINPGAQQTYQSANAAWRLAFWRKDLTEMARQPLTGVGFGPGADFCFQGYCSDQRKSRESSQISGPHNSYVNVAYRTGLPGIVALLGVIAVAVRAAWRGVRQARSEADALTARLAIATFAFAAVTCFFAVGLEGPFIGLFFWVPLGLLLLCGAPAAGNSSRSS
jgi:O-antigen ligase